MFCTLIKITLLTMTTTTCWKQHNVLFVSHYSIICNIINLVNLVRRELHVSPQRIIIANIALKPHNMTQPPNQHRYVNYHIKTIVFLSNQKSMRSLMILSNCGREYHFNLKHKKIHNRKPRKTISVPRASQFTRKPRIDE